ELVADVTRRPRQSDAARPAPDRFVDFPLVPDLQIAPSYAGYENRIAHPASRARFPSFDFLPEFQAPKLESRKLLLDLTTKTLLVALACTLPAARKHPAPIAAPPDQKHASAF